MTHALFLELGLVLAIAVGVSWVCKALFRLPLIIGYILSGLIASQVAQQWFHEGGVLQEFSRMGIVLLLFIVGIHLNPRVVRQIGGVALVMGVGQVVFTSVVGLGIGLLLGFELVTAAYIAVAFAFSSTIVVTRLLADRGDIDSLYGKISVGFLIVQDVIALIILAGISGFQGAGGTDVGVMFGGIFLKLLLAFGAVGILIKWVIPHIDHHIARIPELLFLSALGLCFLCASLFVWLGFSIELGALFAGCMFSLSPYQQLISSRIAPLKDFFLVLFFVFLGSAVQFETLGAMIVPISVFCAYILVGNPLVVMILMRLSGYSLRTGFFAGLTVAQVSEFSLILLALGSTVGHVSDEVVSMATVVGIITIGVSSWLILHAEGVFERARPVLIALGLGDSPDAQRVEKKKRYEVIVFGCHRVGQGIIETLREQGLSFLVIDIDPARVKELGVQGVDALYGDADDEEFLESIAFEHARLVISTIPDYSINLFISRYVALHNPKIICMVSALETADAHHFYAQGVDYVIMPHYLGRKSMSELIAQCKTKKKAYVPVRAQHLKDLFQYDKVM